MSQCHQPLPVGASGSSTRSAKLCVPLGALLQESAGERLPPWQPKPLNTWASAIFAPALMSGLARVNFAAALSAAMAAEAMVSRASQVPAPKRVRFIQLPLPIPTLNGRPGPAPQCAAAQGTVQMGTRGRPVGGRPRVSAEQYLQPRTQWPGL